MDMVLVEDENLVDGGWKTDFLGTNVEAMLLLRVEEGLNPKAVDAVETARRKAALVLNFIGYF